MGNTRVINWGNTPLLLDLQTRCNAPGRSYTWTACDMRSTHVPLRTHSSALCNTGQHPRGRGPPPETRSRLWPMVFGLWLVIIVWCHFMVGGARAEIQYISSAPSVLTPIRLLTISHDFARSLHPSRLLEGFCGVRAPQSFERCKILYIRMSPRFQARAIAVRYEIRSNFEVQLHSQVSHHRAFIRANTIRNNPMKIRDRIHAYTQAPLRAELSTTQ